MEKHIWIHAPGMRSQHPSRWPGPGKKTDDICLHSSLGQHCTTHSHLFYYTDLSQIKTVCSITLSEWVKSLSRVRLFATPWTVARQAPLSMGFSRPEYWSGLPFPSPGDLPDPGIKPRSPALQADSLSSEPPGKPYSIMLSANKNDFLFPFVAS